MPAMAGIMQKLERCRNLIAVSVPFAPRKKVIVPQVFLLLDQSMYAPITGIFGEVGTKTVQAFD
jgi:hypothetical protein